MFGDGKVAVVTGVGPGMGRSIVLGFARHGVDVAFAARRAERVATVADEVRALGRDPVAVPADITDRGACAALVDAAVDRFGGVDFVVQNGHHEGDWARVVDADPDSWRRVFDVNLYGALHLVQAAVPTMRQRGGGSIVLVNSGAALRNPVTMGAYSTSKAALANLTRTLALELGPAQIRVNGVFLGPVKGENLARVADDATKAAELPLGFVPTADQCAGTILFLCSDLAAPVTGQHISVNGGQWIT